MNANGVSITKGCSDQNDSVAGKVPATTTSSRDSNRSKHPARSALDRLKRTAVSLHEDVDLVSQRISQQANKIEQMEQQLENAQQRIQKLEVDLQTRIFRSIPDYQLSDATVSEDFLVFRYSLSEWVEGFPDIKSFTETFYDATYRQGICENMFALQRKFQLQFDHAQTEILTWISFCVIGEYVLGPRVFAAPPADQELMEHLHKGMSMLEPKKVRAYTATQLHKDRVIQHCTGLSEYLRGFFSYFRFEETFDWDQKFRRLEKQWERYRDVGADGTLPIIIDKSHLSDFIIMDAHTHQTLNPQAARFASMQDDAPIGVFLLVVYPALFRWDPTTQSFILIQKAVVLIQGYESLPPDLKAEVDSLETEG
ncbi:hypothetical protein BDV32DRAFT_142667 [Aspergillus pseudonomiae]|uniref:Uncharacterized protein n=1 Tax=Aspergillus pseudonomiae TaxID=1506151 RepID=A0A5N7CVV9_9EURO|nr:uncharacterized protein BDV37DRAFT_291136 [Aspergillus pseudonomiae]KAB8254721.1 hypothetical protein BDV32DRAFT_142667 [Aspergillus pseudonomiae]KAE8398312.1 hypothetical protein BDV37DRAFT_291136 [Aspergillus pseudonomiae]